MDGRRTSGNVPVRDVIENLVAPARSANFSRRELFGKTGMTWRVQSRVPGCCACFVLAALPLLADVTLTGRVVDENEVPVPAAHVTVLPAPGSATAAPPKPWETQTDPTGAFRLNLPATGDYLVSVERAGYYALKGRPVRVEGTQEVTLTLNTVREVFQSADVNAETSPVDVGQTENQEHLSGTEVNDIPYANSHSLRSAMTVMPGVLEDADRAHSHQRFVRESGAVRAQRLQHHRSDFRQLPNCCSPWKAFVRWTFPPARYSPEFGKGSAGVLAINTENGTDTFHYTATDFIPGLKLQQGPHLGKLVSAGGFLRADRARAGLVFRHLRFGIRPGARDRTSRAARTPAADGPAATCCTRRST